MNRMETFAISLIVTGMLSGCATVKPAQRSEVEDFSAFTETCLQKWRQTAQQCQQFWLDYQAYRVKPGTSAKSGYNSVVIDRFGLAGYQNDPGVTELESAEIIAHSATMDSIMHDLGEGR